MRARRFLLAALVLLTAASLASPAAARLGMGEPLTERGAIIEDIYVQIFIAGTIVFLVVFLLLAWAVWRYREGSGHGRATHEKERHNLKAEMLWTGVPLLIVLWVGWIAYVGLAQLDYDHADDPDAMEIRIEASQWNWRAEYGNKVVLYSNPSTRDGSVDAQNHFFVPADVPIRWNITSLDVIHSWHIADANFVTVFLMDANPAGPHRFNHGVTVLPEGTYLVQCSEMCLNPGHAYMRAVINAVPRADFEHWLEGHAVVRGAELVQDIGLTVGPNGINVETNQTVVQNTRVRVLANNQLGEPITLRAGSATREVAPRSTAWFAFDVPPGGVTLEVEGIRDIRFNAIEAKVERVELGAFRLIPDRLELQSGETYLIQIHNTHSAPHNLFIGRLDQPDGAAASPTIGLGETAAFIYTAGEPGTLDMWCNVPGHVGLGMVGKVTIR